MIVVAIVTLWLTIRRRSLAWPPEDPGPRARTPPTEASSAQTKTLRSAKATTQDEWEIGNRLGVRDDAGAEFRARTARGGRRPGRGRRRRGRPFPLGSVPMGGVPVQHFRALPSAAGAAGGVSVIRRRSSDLGKRIGKSFREDKKKNPLDRIRERTLYFFVQRDHHPKKGGR